jgi:cobalt-precorrin 5A hydrolase/precorrin-3B C17-methyltransferase
MTATGPRPAVLVLSQSGVEHGRAAARALDGELFGLAGRVEGAETAFADTGETLRALFGAGRPLVGVCAAGILIRCLAPLLAERNGGDKRWRWPRTAVPWCRYSAATRAPTISPTRWRRRSVRRPR